jgi:hypothetical protein
MILDSGWGCEKVALALLAADDTIRLRHGFFVAGGLERMTRFEAAAAPAGCAASNRKN